jgi:hypothetical protein
MEIKMKRYLVASSLAVLFAMLPFSVAPSSSLGQDITITVRKDDKPTKQPFTGTRPAVDVAILLDTSNSMDGLISQAKSQLWKIVQEFAEAEKSGQTPQLRVSVFEYGNSNLPATEGFIRQVCQLTDDLDKVSESLFSLSTDGGDEYCGTVINEALKRLDWSSHDNSYKAIFIAGNEPFTQGEVNYKKSCQLAIEKGVVINTIHCGNYQAGVQGKWKHGAELAEGKYLNIDQDRTVVRIKAPQDEIIIKLNSELNKTYLWYGAKSDREGWSSNQILQDSNSLKSGGIVTRSLAKSSKVYGNRGRDLVDTWEADKNILESTKDSSLPEAMQRMTADERKAHIEKMASRRAEIKKQMAEATKERAKYIAGQQKSKSESGQSTLGDAVSGTVREQLQRSGFNLKK